MRPGRIAILQLSVVSIMLLGLLLGAQAQVYKWVDKQGTAHFTDNPDELPEPQRSEALRKIEEKLKKKKTTPEPTQPAIPPTERLPPDPGISGSEMTGPDRSTKRRQKKELWQSKVSAARSNVAALEKRCKQLESEAQKSGRDSLIFARPGDRKKSTESASALKACQNSLKQARHHLEVEIPQQARKQNVPPGWLR